MFLLRILPRRGPILSKKSRTLNDSGRPELKKKTLLVVGILKTYQQYNTIASGTNGLCWRKPS